MSKPEHPALSSRMTDRPAVVEALSRRHVDPALLHLVINLLTELGDHSDWSRTGGFCPWCGIREPIWHGQTCPLGRARTAALALAGDERALAILRRSDGKAGDGQTFLLGDPGEDPSVRAPLLQRHRDYQGDEPAAPGGA